ncbi:restriction endonuclease subunit S [Pedobacter sp. PLR]|uniref:restriction endonuclease subunit S n=1 Tax=Pedobacter sp. PLR TaxID=2994465 RepID=UPI0022484C97|nr:restriction endonuclease subunit S [Pedobacter sp. PLR]MCX2450033.1 restriction endonuclease subunit S [Pedobacter sp. PLR]
MGEKELPEGWISTSLKNVVVTKKGKKPKILSDIEFKNSVPYLDIKALEKNEIRQYADVESSNLLETSDIAILWDGARSGWVSKGKEGAIGSTLAGLKPILVNTNYIFYFLKSKFDLLNTNTRGSGIPHVDPAVLWNLEFLLPPLAEQNRIVGKLDKLFVSIEVVRTKLDTIPQLLKNFRQAVLSQAVTGKLTEKSRGSDSISYVAPISIGEICDLKPEGWGWKKILDLAKLESGHTPRKSLDEYWVKGEVPWISLQDIRMAHGKMINSTKYMPNELGIKNSSARLLPAGTVCFCRDISVGYTTIMGRSMATSQHFANWICGDLLYNRYLLYAFMAAKDSLIASGTGTTVGTIYMPALKEMRILLPPFEEQQEIVSRVEVLFAKADLIEEQYQVLKGQIDVLPQSILSKAFRGELVAQNPNDEPASELLERIKETQSLGKKVIRLTQVVA